VTSNVLVPEDALADFDAGVAAKKEAQNH